MIFDHICNARLYTGLGPNLDAALRFLEREDLSKLPNGRHELDGDKLFASISEYTTKPEDEAKWEAHRKYMDIQFLIKGIERIGVAYTPEMTPVTPFDEEKDFQLLTGKGPALDMRPGFFLALGPDDAHKPGMAFDKPMQVRKAVIKLKVGA